MAFGNPLPFSGYEPHPDIPGAYSFQPTSGGAPVLAAGDEAERLKGLIDRSPKPMANATASNGGIANLPPAALGQAQGMNDFIQGQSAQDFRNSLMAGAPQAHAPSAPPGVNPTAVSPAAPAPQAAAQAAAPVRNFGGGAPPAATTQPQVSAPNLADLDKMLQVTHTKAGYSPTTRKVETSGGMQDEKLANLTGQAYAHQYQAADEEAQAQKLMLTQQVQAGQIAAGQAAKEADALHQKQIANMAAQQEATKEFDRIMAVKQGELADTSKREVDQYRMYRGKPGAQIGAAIAAGLGAFGSSLNHGPNFALDIINRGIDNDIQAQREEINRGVAAKQNDIVRIRDKYGVDTTMAEKLLNMQLTERAQTLARQQAAVIGTQEAQGKLAGIDSALAAKQAAILKDMNDTLNGKAQITAEEKYHQGGTSVGLNPYAVARGKAADLAAKTSKAAGEIAGGEFAAQNEGRTAAQADKANAAGKNADKQLIPTLARANVANEAALAGLDRLEAEVKKGTLHRVGQKFTGLGADTDMATEAQHTAQAIASAEVKGLSPDQGRAENLEHDLQSMNPAQQLAHIHALRQSLLEQKRSILSTSANTAKVGQVGAYEGGGAGGEPE